MYDTVIIPLSFNQYLLAQGVRNFLGMSAE